MWTRVSVREFEYCLHLFEVRTTGSSALFTPLTTASRETGAITNCWEANELPKLEAAFLSGLPLSEFGRLDASANECSETYSGTLSWRRMAMAWKALVLTQPRDPGRLLVESVRLSFLFGFWVQGPVSGA